MNVDSLSFLIHEFSSLLIMFPLSHWNLCFCSHECSAIFDLSISSFVVFLLCSFTLVCKGLHVSPMYRFPIHMEIDKSKIAEHSWEQKHRFQCDKAGIISKEENSMIRKLKESTFIHYTDHVISQPRIDISLIWLPIIRPIIKKGKKLRRET